MRLLTGPSLHSAISLRWLFIAAANNREIGNPESRGRSHRIRLDDPRCRSQGSPGGDGTADYGIPECNLRSSAGYAPGRQAKRYSEVLNGFGRQRLRAGTTALA
jgi:hypothetical protein